MAAQRIRLGNDDGVKKPVRVPWLHTSNLRPVRAQLKQGVRVGVAHEVEACKQLMDRSHTQRCKYILNARRHCVGHCQRGMADPRDGE